MFQPKTIKRKKASPFVGSTLWSGAKLIPIIIMIVEISRMKSKRQKKKKKKIVWKVFIVTTLDYSTWEICKGLELRSKKYRISFFNRTCSSQTE